MHFTAIFLILSAVCAMIAAITIVAVQRKAMRSTQNSRKHSVAVPAAIRETPSSDALGHFGTRARR
jgi:hypothetical protein